ncbi:MAG TPA: carbohydrate ABC transporter permease [Chloroflexota bacterium]|nr:carbohydrate ABC transporter permease [Chloroflexota bacterium]
MSAASAFASRGRQAAVDRRRFLLRRGRHLGLRASGGLLLAFVLLVALFPPYFMTITAFHPPSLSFSRTPTLFSLDLSFRAFVDLFEKYPFAAWMANTALVSVCSTILSVTVATLAAYSLSRLRYPGRGTLSSAIFFVYLFPSTLLFIPIFIVLNNLHLLNQLPALIAVYLTFAVPFSVWLLKAYFLSIPRELEDAAQVDGATRWQSLVLVVLPLATPGVAVACIYSFTLAWNEYLYAFTLLSDQEKFTLATGLTKLIFGDVFLWGMIMAGGVLMSAPLLILYFVAQRYIVAGLSAGAIKG